MPSNVNRNVMLNREAPPFNNPELLRAAALSVDRKAFIDILTEGKGNIGGAMLISAAPCYRRRKVSGACRPIC